MKKISLILAAVMVCILALTGCGDNLAGNESGSNSAQPQASSALTENSPAKPQESSKPTESTLHSSSKPAENAPAQTGDLLSAAYADIMKSNTFTMRYKSEVVTKGETISVEATMITDGSNSYMEMAMANMGVTTYMLSTEEEIYMLDPDTETYMTMPLAEGEDTQTIDASDLVYTGTGKDTVLGKEMVYEEYSVIDGTMRYYFEGSELAAISVKETEGESIMEILEFSDKVDESKLKLPDGYTESEGFTMPDLSAYMEKD